MLKRSTIIPTLALVAFLVGCTHRQVLTNPEAGNSNDPIPTTEEEIATAESATPEPAVDETLDTGSTGTTEELAANVEEPEFSSPPVPEPEAAPVVKKKSKKFKSSKVKTAKMKSNKPRMKRKVAAKARDIDVATTSAGLSGGDGNGDSSGTGTGLTGGDGYQAGAEAVAQTATTETTIADSTNINREPASVAPPSTIPDPTLTPEEQPLAVEAGTGGGWPFWATLLIMGGLVVAGWGIFRGRGKSDPFSYRN